MEAKIYGSLTRPALIIIGTWDPFLSDFFTLLDQVNEYCKSNNLETLLVLLEPDPAHLIHNKVLPIYDCWETRIRFLRAKCIGAVCKFSIKELELRDGVEEIMATFFKQQIKVAELWLYEGQALGRGGKSTGPALTKSCTALGIAVKIMSRELKVIANNAKMLLAESCIEEASSIVGHPPLWQTDNTTKIHIPIGWQTGLYEYRPATLSECLEVQFCGSANSLEVYPKINKSVFNWPDAQNKMIAILGAIKR